jgi:hypothetical protein
MQILRPQPAGLNAEIVGNPYKGALKWAALRFTSFLRNILSHNDLHKNCLFPRSLA